MSATKPSRNAPEMETLASFLDYYRDAVARKVSGVEAEGLRFSPVESGTCLGGLIKHLAYVERWWFQAVWAGQEPWFPWTENDPDADFRAEPDDTADSLIALYQRECEESRRIVAGARLDDTVAGPHGDISLRWLTVHMIEETARHAGHADLIREMVDGAVGH